MWIKKPKIQLTLDKRRILTPDGKQILVGANEDMVLISQDYQSLWVKKTKSNS